MLIILFIIPLTLIIIFGAWIFNLNIEIQSRFESRQILAPTSYYSDSMKFEIGQKLPKIWVDNLLLGFRVREEEQTLFPGDMAYWNSGVCQKKINKSFSENESCIAFYATSSAHPNFQSELMQVFSFNENSEITHIYAGDQLTEASSLFFPPVLIAQYLGTQPILKDEFELKDVPSYCLNAVTSIEDQNFLKHSGVSYSGIARAVIKNLIERRAAQGGSTITQQLVKNYFLTPEKTIIRKIKEFVISILLEKNYSKDKIFETYLNIIYLGQNGTYQVRGFKSAAQYYFQKDLSQLNIPECALLAAIVNSPGGNNPWNKKPNALARRDLVLKKMLELNHISAEEFQAAHLFPLPENQNLEITATSPYFFEATQREAKQLGFHLENSKVFTTLSPLHQKAAQISLASHIAVLEKNNAIIKKNREEKNKTLEGAFVSLDNKTGGVLALVGGRTFATSPFNRILDSERSIGSTVKPFVYLSLAQHLREKNQPMPPTFTVEDRRFIHKFDRQKWSPENYDKVYHGDIPVYYALKNSLNTAAGKVVLDITPVHLIQTLRQFKLSSKIPDLPSIALGSFSVKPIELINAYSAIVNLGQYRRAHFIKSVELNTGEVLRPDFNSETLDINRNDLAILVGMMRQSVINGTAKSAAQLGLQQVSAGKTGTTNDNKDTWFVGFTPYVTALAWTGYDDNSGSGLTGASGSLPIWVSYVNQSHLQFPVVDFQIPESCRMKEITKDDLFALKNFPENEKDESPANLIFCD